jgi:tetratricopeptide (TPR) repeat protein
MRKLSVLVIALLVAMGSFAQNIQVQTAYNHHKKAKLKEALEAIQPALEHSQTSTQAKTWFYYANICLDIAQDATGAYTNVLANPLDEAVRGYLKALELDKRDEYKDDILQRLLGISVLYSDKGVTAYEAKQYAIAAEDFAKAYEIRAKAGSSDMSMLKYAGTCWLDAGNWEKAEEAFNKLKDANYKDAMIYIGLAKIAVAKGELEKAVQYLDEGETKFPKDLTLLTEKANMYMVGELSELDKHAALNTLKKIIDIEPNNASVWNSLGACYAMDEATFDEAAAAYKKSIELDPKFISAYYGYCKLYLDEANHYINEANNLPLDDTSGQYDVLTKKSEEIFLEVLPFVEQAHALDTSDSIFKQILKELYIKLKMMDKAAEIK